MDATDFIPLRYLEGKAQAEALASVGLAGVAVDHARVMQRAARDNGDRAERAMWLGFLRHANR